MTRAQRHIRKRTFSGLYVASILDILHDLGLETADALDALGMKAGALENPRTRIADRSVRDLFKMAEGETGNVLVGLETGYRFRVASFSATGNILTFCRTLRQAAEVNARYAPLAETAGLSEFTVVPTPTGERHHLRWTPEFDEDDDFRHLTELVLGGYATTVRWLGWAMEGDITHVTLRHDIPAATPTMDAAAIDALYRRIFQCTPEFCARHNDVALPDGTVDLELPTHSPGGLRRQSERLDAILFNPPAGGGRPSVAGIRDALCKGLAEGHTTREHLSRKLDLTLPALDRELAAADTNFSTLLEEVRREGFDRLSARGLKLTEIAHELGFNDQAALTRAFKRWHGTTPGRYLSAL